ncbi:MAG: hypothetical protein ACREOU_15570 [Candidatus Eiseniibacteriota bacterium]
MRFETIPHAVLAAGAAALALFLATLAPGLGPRALAVAADSTSRPVQLLDLAPGERLLTQSSALGFQQGKYISASAESVYLWRGSTVTAVQLEGIERSWYRSSGALKGLLVGAAFGAAATLFMGAVDGSDCYQCPDGYHDEPDGFPIGDIVLMGAIGALDGLIDGRWEPLDPPASALPKSEHSPWPRWGASIRGGITTVPDWNVEPDETSGGSTRLTGWMNGSPSASWGFEYGLLSSGQSEYLYSAPSDTFVTDTTQVILPGYTMTQVVETRLLDVEGVFRWRKTKGSVRLYGIAGLGVYVLKKEWITTQDYTNGYRSQGAYDGYDSALGLSGGIGSTFGQGRVRPAVEFRGRFAFWDQARVTLSLEAGLDFN